ncbi:MAG: hypothetical protein IMY71_05265 [Bacteroidetes bacterium]|nr:hypothetical protein [Bacteroidota bacterium]
MAIYQVSKKFPKDEFYSLTTPIKKSSRLYIARSSDCRLKNAKYNEISHFRHFKLKALNSYVAFNYPEYKMIIMKNLSSS